MGSEWRKVKLEEVASEITVGYVGSMTSEYIDSGVPFLRSKNVDPFTINRDDIKYISSEFNEKLKKSALAPGDVVIVRTGKPGTCAVIPEWLENANCSDLVIVRCGPEINNRFLAYYVNTVASSHVNAHLVGAVQQHFNVGSAKLMELSLPPLEMQDKIVSILAALDNKIALNRQINTTLESMAQALFKSWFVDFDPVIDNALAAGHEIPDALQKRAAARAARREALRQQTNKTANETIGATDADSPEQALPDTGLSDQRLPPEIQQLFPDRFVLTEEMGWVPEGWEVKTIGDVVETTGGGTPSTKNPDFWEGGVHPFCTPKDMSQLTSWVLMDTERHLTDDGVNKISSGQLPKGTVLMSSRAPIGYLAISDVPVSVNQGVIALLPNTVFGPLYLLNWLHANLGVIMDRANGSTFLEISKKNFRPIPFLIPSNDVAKAFNEQAKAIQQKLLLLAEETVSLTNLRDSLLPKLLSGQITIPDAEQQLAEVL